MLRIGLWASRSRAVTYKIRSGLASSLLASDAASESAAQALPKASGRCNIIPITADGKHNNKCHNGHRDRL